MASCREAHTSFPNERASPGIQLLRARRATGYNYCVACGRIDSAADPDPNLSLYQPHSRPYPSAEEGLCPGRVANRVVLGTDFRTDIALFSLSFDDPFRVRPGNDETSAALRTVCEAISKAACNLLEIESGEILAEYRPALTEAGAAGLEAEVFIYDTLAGGAGFSPQLVGRGVLLCDEALRILTSCPGKCDASCYRCLRSFRNRLDHRLLDRHLGEQLLRHALYGGYPDYPKTRVDASLDVLFSDLTRQFAAAFDFQRHVIRVIEGETVTIPILATRRSSNVETWLALSSPIAPSVPVHEDLRALDAAAHPIVCIDDLLVRHHLPSAVQTAMSSSVTGASAAPMRRGGDPSNLRVIRTARVERWLMPALMPCIRTGTKQMHIAGSS